MDTELFSGVTVRDLMHIGAAFLAVIVVGRMVRRILAGGKKSQHVATAHCPKCNWTGQVSRYAARCPKCNNDLGKR